MRVGIVGLGLIGGSLGLALRRLRHSIDVTGVARRAENAAAAGRRGGVGPGPTGFWGGLGCGIVGVAAPLDQIARVIERLAPTVPARTPLTDVATVQPPV